MIKDVNCPYCKHPQDINHDDGYGYTEELIYQQICGACGSTFTYTTSIMFYYDAQKADCLNGGEHDYHPTHTFPQIYTMMQCYMCGKERSLTKEEKEKFIIKP